jgi:hypothetical protein
MALTDVAVRNIKAKSKSFKKADGGGLYLLVTAQGGKLWRFDYKFFDTRKTLALGKYPEVTLAEARAARDEAKVLLVKGIDPGAQKKKVNAETALAVQTTFGKIGRNFLDKMREDGRAEATMDKNTWMISRPTSLARFVTGSLKVGGTRKAGVSVEVEPGKVRRLPGAWLIRLRAGSESNLDTASNVGLAVRTKNGRTPPGYKPVKIAPNVYLLYGPSVAQALFSAGTQAGVAKDIEPKTLQFLEDEFWRQMELNK